MLYLIIGVVSPTRAQTVRTHLRQRIYGARWTLVGVVGAFTLFRNIPGLSGF